MEGAAVKSKWSARDIAYIAIMAGVIAVCSWISIPTTVPFTLQTFAVFLAVGVLGGRRGTFAVLAYILLGAVGLPVFAGFRGGLGAPSDGYIVGFLFAALIYWGMTALLGNSAVPTVLGMVLGLVVCYAFGTAWFVVVYAQTKGPISVLAALGMCVFPFIPVDLLKLALAMAMTKVLRPHVK